MTKLSCHIRATLLFLLTACTSLAAQAAENQAAVEVGGQKLVFQHIVAFEGVCYEEKRIVVLATGQKLTPDLIAKVRKKDAEENNDVELSRPYLKAVYLESGELRCFIGRGGNTSYTTRDEAKQGDVKIADGRAKGRASLVEDDDFPKKISLTFDVPYGTTEAAPADHKPQGPVKPTITGKFLGNGKPAKLAFVTAHHREPFSDEEAITLVFTEKDHSTKKQPWIPAGFGDFGSALILHVDVTGSIFGCEVAHSAHEKSGFSALGAIHMVEFDITSGNVRGHVSTGGEQDAFDQKWDVDLTFAAPLPPDPKKQALGSKTTATAKKKQDATPAEPKPRETKPAAPAIKVTDLPLPKGAFDIEYKTLVEQMKFKCPAKVPAAAGELTKNLTAQGWTKDGSDLVTPKSAILKRKRGSAELTIMFKPEAQGSIATVFTEGLNWDDAEQAAPAAAADADEFDVNGAIQEALDKVRNITDE